MSWFGTFLSLSIVSLFVSSDWYRDAQQTLVKYQEELLKNDTEAQQNEHEKHLEVKIHVRLHGTLYLYYP